MCGIVGIINKRDQNLDVKLSNMVATLRHRGPDSEGIWISTDKKVGLGHSRLSIIDVKYGQQPMLDVTNTLIIVFNGEIYNYLELKDFLFSKGHVFTNNTDTEVILAAYKEWGLASLSKLNGMFSFCLYDRNLEKIFLVRDRVGEKPLYYTNSDKGLAFSSEIKAILSDPNFSRNVNLDALNYYLTYGSTNGSSSIFTGLNKVRPGEVVIYCLKKNSLNKRKYWELPKFNKESEKEPKYVLEKVKCLLVDSVKRQLVADVPVGIFLSGGLDSSLITAIAAQVSGKPLNTYTVSFPGEKKFDESSHASLIASHFDTNHEVLEMGPFNISILYELAKQFDEPIGDQALVPSYLISKQVGSKTKVALSGDGGDELFGGYGHYAYLEKLIPLSTKLLIFKSKLGKFSEKFLPIGFKGRNYFVALKNNPETLLESVNMYFDYYYRRQLLSPVEDFFKCSRAPENYKLRLSSNGPSILNRAMVNDFHTTLADVYLPKVDRASMLASLEVRCPWLDYRLVEFAFSEIPDSFKVNKSCKKIIPKRLAKDLLPKSFDIDRKQGFVMPMAKWFDGHLGNHIEEILMNMDENLFNKEIIYSLIKSQKNGNNNMQRIFALTMFALWSQEYNVSVQ